jgi:hypothetical protein
MHVSLDTLDGYVKRGDLPYVNVGRSNKRICYRFEESDLEELTSLLKRKPAALYRHFDANGVLLYVGIAVDPVQRLNGHRSGSRWYDQISRVDIERYPTREAALAAALAAIRNEKPLHNIVGRVAA